MDGTIMSYIYIFALAVFIGFELIAKVPPLLHTPLMSGSNAISGITVVGALLIAGIGSGGQHAAVSKILGLAALILAVINVVGGFMVTDRMLEMFKKDKAKDRPVEKEKK